MATTGEPFGLFWDSENGDRTYSAASFEYWLKKFFTSGVFNGDLQVKAKSGMTLEIDPGYANVDGKVKFWNGAFTVTLDAANSTYPRIDTIIIRRDNVNRQIICEKVTGSYSADTPQPTAPTRNSEIYDLVTAQIYVGAGVTEITQSNITDTRPNNELCGYITGTVEELDFSAFTAQFEAYFAEFKRNQMADFQAWEVAQKAAYAAWFSLVQQQQIQDKADWDAWYAALQEELHELPEDTAEYLQIEIDEIRTSGTTGSILKITTTETSLEGKTVTITNGTETRTATFDENLECLISGYKGTGEVTISSTDGIQTATTVVTIPYFGNYQYAIAFWAATVNIQGDDNLKGATITVKDSDDLTVGTVVLNVITGRGVFTATKADTYTFNYTVSGTSYSESLAVTEETTYSLSLSAGFDWKGWVDTAQFLDSSDYNSLDEVLADELAVRELCLEHACVDYLAAVLSVNADIETIINNDLFAKWVNNSDYSLDVLGANVAIKALMDTADKYGYGEWVITDDSTTPPTWGPKGNVPIMTANNAPYGEASASSTYSGMDAYKAFDGNANDRWSANTNAGTSARITYKFTNPVCVKEVSGLFGVPSGTADITFKIQASNTGIAGDFVDLDDGFHHIGQQRVTTKLDNDNYYLYYSILCTNNANTGYMSVGNLQFYGRELSVSVPTMTSNTAPYGEVTGTGTYSGYPEYKAFDGKLVGYNNAGRWATSIQNAYIMYKFNKPMIAKMFYLYVIQYSDNRADTCQIYGSNDGLTFTPLKNVNLAQVVSVTANSDVVTIENEIAYQYYKFEFHKTSSYMTVDEIKIFGLDYSEKEFESGTTKKWLYDHGVELETLTYKQTGSGTVEKGDSQIRIGSGSSTTNVSQVNYHNCNFANYDLMRLVVGDSHYSSNANNPYLCARSSNDSSDYARLKKQTISNPYTDFALDISSVNAVGIYMFGMDGIANIYTSIKEMWLE